MELSRPPGQFSPILAVHGSEEDAIAERAYGWVAFAFVRDGTVSAYGDIDHTTLQRGDVLIVQPTISCGGRPGPNGVAWTTVLVDPDLLTDTSAWQYSAVTRNRAVAERDWRRRFPTSATSLGEALMTSLEPLLDELVTLSNHGSSSELYRRAASLLFKLLDLIEPRVATDRDSLQPLADRRVHERESAPRQQRPPAPLRAEVRQAEQLLRNSLSRSWKLDELAAAVGLSRNRLRDLFVDGFGRTPYAHLTLLRAQQLAVLLQDTDLTIPEAMREVGWKTPSHGAKLFRRYAGVSPRQFRAQARPASRSTKGWADHADHVGRASATDPTQPNS